MNQPLCALDRYRQTGAGSYLKDIRDLFLLSGQEKGWQGRTDGQEVNSDCAVSPVSVTIAFARAKSGPELSWRWETGYLDPGGSSEVAVGCIFLLWYFSSRPSSPDSCSFTLSLDPLLLSSPHVKKTVAGFDERSTNAAPWRSLFSISWLLGPQPTAQTAPARKGNIARAVYLEIFFSLYSVSAFYLPLLKILKCMH